jgi:hypothetical protein
MTSQCLRVFKTISTFGTELSKGGPTSIGRSQSSGGADDPIEAVHDIDDGIWRFHFCRNEIAFLRSGRCSHIRSGASQGSSFCKRGRNGIGASCCPTLSEESDGRKKTFRLFLLSCRATLDLQKTTFCLDSCIFHVVRSTNQHLLYFCTLHIQGNVCYCLSVVAETCSYSSTGLRLRCLSVWGTTFFAYFWTDLP